MYYNYSLTQQIFTPCEIGTAGTINSIAFDYKYTGSFSMDSIQVYLMHTTKSNFESTTDMVALTNATLVWEGTFAASTNGWITLTLTTPFVYDGQSNLLLCCYDRIDDYPGSSYVFRTTSTTADYPNKYLAMSYYSDGYIPNLTNVSSFSSNKTRYQYRNNIKVNITPDPSVVMCCPVQNLKAANVEAYSAKLTWDSDATSFEVQYKKSTDTIWSPATANGNLALLETLTPKTTYNARVRVDCGGGDYSDWKTVNFTTLPSCLVPTNFASSNLTYHGVTLSWTSEASEWMIQCIATATNDTTNISVSENPYIITTLAPETAYKARVRANCGSQDGLSDWTSFKTFTTKSTCSAPTNLTCTANTTTSATLSWVEVGNSTAWDVQYWHGTDTVTIPGVTANPYTITGLTVSTVYTGRVRGACGSAWSSTLTFNTEFAVPVIEPFATTSLPGAWKRYSGLLNDVTGGTAHLAPISGYWNFGTGNGVFDSHAKLNIYGTSCKHWLVTPNLVMENNVQLDFDLALTDYYGTLQPIVDTLQQDDRFVVLIATIRATDTTWTVLREWNNTGSEYVFNNIPCSAIGQHVTIDLSSYAGQNIAVAFYGESTIAGGDNNLHIDNVSIDYIPACAIPTGFSATHPYGHGATLSWTSEASAWVVAYKKADSTNYFTEIPNVHENPYTIAGLDPETTYIVKVKADCGGIYSDYTNTVSFTTTVACPAPTGLTATLTEGDGSVATLNWVSDASEFVVRYINTVTHDTTIVTPNVTDTTCTLTGLTPETTYSANVKAVCGGIDGESAWSSAVVFTPTDTYSLTVNDSTNTNGYVPIYGFYVDQYSKSQFIIPATALTDIQWGTISRLTFYAATTSTNWGDAEFEVYMTEVDTTAFAAATLLDWGSMTKVMKAGKLAISDKKMIVTLDTPYTYTGGNLVIGIHQSKKGQYNSCSWYGVNQATNTAIGGYENSAKGVSFQKFLPKTTFNYVPGEAPACLPPTNLTVTYTSGTTAEVSWTSDATAWNLKVNDSLVPGTITNPYILEDLAFSTTYRVEVQNDCGEFQSDWIGPVSFTTDACMPEDMTIINYTLTDSWGDGWNGNYILVYDGNCDMVAALTIESGDTNTGTLKVCGSYVMFAWYKGSYPGETSWEFTDTNGTTLFSGQGTTSMATGDVIYVLDNAVCKRPSNFDVSEIGPHSAKLSWTEHGTATAWQIMLNDDINNLIDADTNPFTITGLDPDTDYIFTVRAVGNNIVSDWPCESAIFTSNVACPMPTDLEVTSTPIDAEVSWNGWSDEYALAYAPYTPTSTAAWLRYDNGTHYTNIGNTDRGTWTWGVMYPDSLLPTNRYLYKVAFYESPTYFQGTNYFINIYAGDNTAPVTLLGTVIVSPNGVGGLHEVGLYPAINIPAGQNLWITMTATGTYVMPACTVSNANNQWWYTYKSATNSYSWSNMGTDNSALASYGWMIRGYVDNLDPSTLRWTEVPTAIADTTYTIDGLSAETNYVVRVQGDCGSEDGVSLWALDYFTTPSACDAVFNLETEVSDTIATLSWTGYQESYNIRYRKYGDVTYFEGFENGIPSDWTTVDGDGDEENWMAVSELGENYAYYLNTDNSVYVYEGEDAALSASAYNNVGGGYTPLNANNWLITPKIDLGSALQFQAWAVGDYGDQFEVLVSTTTADTTAFTSVQALTDPSGLGYDMVNVDLSAYDGQKGYIAIRHQASDGYFLVIDNFSIIQEIENPQWTNTSTTTETLGEITFDINVELNSVYEWQVQGINASCTDTIAWSEIAYFHTVKQASTITQPFDLTEGWNSVSLYIKVNDDDEAIAMLDQLKAGLDESGLSIMNDEYYTDYEDGEWFGDMDEIGVTNYKSYDILVNEDISFEIEGMPTDPADYVIPITEGWNYIGYPCTEEVEIAVALSRFEAFEGDMIVSIDGSTSFEDGEWFGDFDTFMPGQGYQYLSMDENDKEIVFKNASRKIRLTSPNSGKFDWQYDKKFDRQNAKEFEVQCISVPLELNKSINDKFTRQSMKFMLNNH